MRFVEQHIAQAEKLFEVYDGTEPLHLYLKKFFKRNKKFGSKDRKNIAEYLYAAYRLGRENRHLDFRTRVFLTIFLKGEKEVALFETYFPDLVSHYEKPLEEKVAFVRNEYEVRDTYRGMEDISKEVNAEAYRNSFYSDPKVFIRLRKKDEALENKLLEIGESHGNACYSFDAKTKLNELLEEKDYVVQDYSSQRTAEYFPQLSGDESVWDCCAGSGGKSILLLDKYPEVELTLTDIRVNILESLIKRFKLYDLGAETIMELNINKEKELLKLEQDFDFIICDAPCTGSGTWARTPEDFYFFDKKQIEKFHKRQLDILTNASQKLKGGKEILYITCSVYKHENEEVVEAFLAANSSFKLVQQDYLHGTELGADTMFVARLIRNQ